MTEIDDMDSVCSTVTPYEYHPRLFIIDTSEEKLKFYNIFQETEHMHGPKRSCVNLTLHTKI